MWKRLNDKGREERKLELLLRIGVAGCYIGHGAFGVIGKEAWLPYFAVAGIGPDLAWTLMPIVGSIDIVIGVLALLWPRPTFLVYAAGWAVWTALLRPLAGESFFETLERAGNYGVPIAFLLLAAANWRPTLAWLNGVEVPALTAERRRHVRIALQATTATLLVGHGGLAFLGKPLLIGHATALGLPEGSLALVGAFEIALAAVVAFRPSPSLLIGVLAWKVGTEALYPLTGAPFWEFVERAGSYIAPLALWTMVRQPARARLHVHARTAVWALLVGAGAVAGGVLGAGPVLAISVTRQAPNESAGLGAAQEATESARAVAAAVAGGVSIVCRHAETNSFSESEPVDYNDSTTQRLLNRAGERQSVRLGEAMRRLGIDWTEVVASPMNRARRTAELMTNGTVRIDSIWHTNGSSYEGAVREARRQALRLPAASDNRLIVSHIGTMSSVLDGIRGRVGEGDCVVVRPADDGYMIVGVVKDDEWRPRERRAASALLVPEGLERVGR